MAVGADSLYFHRRQELSLNTHDPRCTWLHSQHWVTESKPCWEIPPVYLRGWLTIQHTHRHTHTLPPHTVEWVSFSAACLCWGFFKIIFLNSCTFESCSGALCAFVRGVCVRMGNAVCSLAERRNYRGQLSEWAGGGVVQFIKWLDAESISCLCKHTQACSQVAAGSEGIDGEEHTWPFSKTHTQGGMFHKSFKLNDLSGKNLQKAIGPRTQNSDSDWL